MAEPNPSLTATNVQVIRTAVGSLFLPEIIPTAVGTIFLLDNYRSFAMSSFE